MTLTANPHELLYKAAEVLQERAQTHGDFENNFQLIADIASLRLGRDMHPYDICIILECVKDARMFANPTNVDNYLDGINYRAFAALFAQDYVNSQSAHAGVAYIKKNELKKADMKPVEVINKGKQSAAPSTNNGVSPTLKGQLHNGSLTVDSLSQLEAAEK